MSFTLPYAFFGLALIPAVIMLRLLALRPRELVVPSLMLYDKLQAPPAEAMTARRKKFGVALFLQCLAILAAVLATAGPFVSTKTPEPRRAILVLDTSASMKTKTSGGTTRWEEARKAALKVCEALEGRDTVTIIATAPENRASEVSAGLTKSEAMARINSLAPRDWTGDMASAVFAAKPGTGSNDVLHIFSDRRPDLQPEMLNAAELWLFGGASANCGIVAFGARTNDKGNIEVLVGVGRFGTAPMRTPAIFANGIEVAPISALKSEPQLDRADWFFEIAAKDVEVIEARLTGPADDLDADDRAFAVLSGSDEIMAFVIGEDDPYIRKALESLGVAVTFRSEEGASQQKNADFIVFNAVAPKSPPGVPCVFIAPPEGTAFFNTGGEIVKPAFGLQTESRLFGRMPVTGIRINRSVTISPKAGEEGRFAPLITCPEGTLAAEWRGPETAAVVFGFRLGWINEKSDTNWAQFPSFVILWSNIVDELTGSSGPKTRHGFRHYRTGDEMPLKAREAVKAEVTGPDGKPVEPDKSGAFVMGSAGIYRTGNGAEGRKFAANLLDEGESDNSDSRSSPRVDRPTGGTGAFTEARRNFTPWFYVAAMALLLGAWLVESRGI